MSAEHAAEIDRTPHTHGGTDARECTPYGTRCPEDDVIVTDCHEWAIQCHTRDGDVFTGKHFVSREEAEESGERLARINGAEWWLIKRRRVVTVETSRWTRVIPPVVTEPGDDA